MDHEITIHGQTVEQAIHGSRESMKEEIDRRQKQQPDVEQRIRDGYEAYARLVSAGFNPRAYNDGTVYLDLGCNVADLARVYRAVGRIRFYNKHILDAEAGTVRVSLESEKYRDLRVYYTKRLDPAKPSRCKIVRKAEIVTQLVCDL